MDGKTLQVDRKTIDIKLVPEGEGLFVLCERANQTIHAVVAVFVDDILAVGEPSVVAAFMSLVHEIWSAKFTGFITRGSEDTISHGDFTMSRVSELNFIGLQIRLDDQQKVVFSSA